MGFNARLPFDPVWFFPVTDAVHLVEEYFGGGGFPVWAERALGIQFSNREFAEHVRVPSDGLSPTIIV